MGKLEGKIAVVTGGSSGIGLATAKQFVHEGAYVFITGRRHPELAAAVKEIGRNVTAVGGDVSNLDDLDRHFAQIKREKGKVCCVQNGVSEGFGNNLFEVYGAQEVAQQSSFPSAFVETKMRAWDERGEPIMNSPFPCHGDSAGR